MRKYKYCVVYNARKFRSIIHAGISQSSHNGRCGVTVTSAGYLLRSTELQLPSDRWNIFIGDLFADATRARFSTAFRGWPCSSIWLHCNQLLLESNSETRTGSLPWLVAGKTWLAAFTESIWYWISRPIRPLVMTHRPRNLFLQRHDRKWSRPTCDQIFVPCSPQVRRISDRANDLITAPYPPQTNSHALLANRPQMSASCRRAVRHCTPQSNRYRSSSTTSDTTCFTGAKNVVR